MKLSSYELMCAYERGDYRAAADVVRRNSTGAICSKDVGSLPVFKLSRHGSPSLVPFEIQIWIDSNCWFWNNLEGFGHYDLGEYDFDSVEPPERICIQVWSGD